METSSSSGSSTAVRGSSDLLRLAQKIRKAAILRFVFEKLFVNCENIKALLNVRSVNGNDTTKWRKL